MKQFQPFLQEKAFLFSSYLRRISQRTWLHTHIHSAHTYLGMDKIAVREKQSVASQASCIRENETINYIQNLSR